MRLYFQTSTIEFLHNNNPSLHLYCRDLLVPRKFVVPEGAKEWPDYLWGMPLGVRVGSIRQVSLRGYTTP